MSVPGKSAQWPPAWSEPVVLLSTGRSGGTLMLRLLNCLDGLTVWGEHAGFVKHLAAAFSAVTTGPAADFIEEQRPSAHALAEKRPLRQDPSVAFSVEWVNSFDSEVVQSALRGCMITLMTNGLPPDRRWGFKEIRYRGPEHAFLSELFPRASFVILIRNPAATLRSQYANFGKGRRTKTLHLYLQRITTFNDFAADRAEAGSPRDLLLDYADLTRDPESRLGRIAQFLGLSIDHTPFSQVSVVPRPGDTKWQDGAVIEYEMRSQFLAAELEPPGPEIRACVEAYDRARAKADTG